MNAKVAKEIRRVLRIKYPHLYIKDADATVIKQRRRIYKDLKRRYNALPWNERNRLNFD